MQNGYSSYQSGFVENVNVVHVCDFVNVCVIFFPSISSFVIMSTDFNSMSTNERNEAENYYRFTFSNAFNNHFGILLSVEDESAFWGSFGQSNWKFFTLLKLNLYIFIEWRRKRDNKRWTKDYQRRKHAFLMVLVEKYSVNSSSYSCNDSYLLTNKRYSYI